MQRPGTVVARDQALAADQQAQAAILEAEANLQTAKINLGYTDITSPIAGKIGRTSVTKGNVVGPDSGVLTTIVSQDPMYVTFPVSQREFLQRAADAAQRPDLATSRWASSAFGRTRLTTRSGPSTFVDVTVDRDTDTVLVRATIPNPDGALIDGQLVPCVVADAGSRRRRCVVPQAALHRRPGGASTCSSSRTARRRSGGSRPAATNGTGRRGRRRPRRAASRSIVEGLQSVRPGMRGARQSSRPPASRS